MIEPLILLLFLLGVAISLADFTKGFLVCVVTGLIQDPLRKLVTGQPVYLTVLVGAMLAITFAGALLRGNRLNFRPIHDWDNCLHGPLTLFGVVIAFQCINAYLTVSSVVVPIIGLIAYLAPLPALLLAYRFAVSPERVVLFMRVYLVVGLAMLSGIYLSFFGYDWAVLKSVGKGLIIYGAKGAISLPSGFFRAPEVASWHAATAICFLIILATITKRQAIQIVNVLLIPVLLGAIMLTGRRKMYMEIAMFITVYGLLVAWFRRGSMKLAVTLAMLCLVMMLVTFGDFISEETNEALQPFLKRSTTYAKESPLDRLLNNSVYSFQWVIRKNGFFGSGAGTGSQGAQHFGAGKSAVTGDAAEGGVAKVLAELGIPGVLAFTWFLVGVGRYLVKVAHYARTLPDELGNLTYGLLAFLAANSVVFVSAGQIFGDVFVLLILGWLVGFIMAVPRMQTAPQPIRYRQRQWGEGTPLAAPVDAPSP